MDLATMVGLVIEEMAERRRQRLGDFGRPDDGAVGEVCRKRRVVQFIDEEEDPLVLILPGDGEVGVADFDSLGEVVMPCAPMCAVTALPYLSQPPPGAFVHACRRAVVRPRDVAVTVMTRVALPVR